MKDGELSRQEIESHSSALTNKRIDEILCTVNKIEFEANVAMPPTVQHAIQYHAILLTLYFETSAAYEQDKEFKQAISQKLKDGHKMYLFLKNYSDFAKQGQIEWSINNSLTFRNLMHIGLQNLKYFFRFGKHDPQGLKQTLELLNFTEEDRKPVIEKEK
ncbi:MAG: hypothetical protein IH934_04720 [Nanoarchaeota archaeon]|nr:hypothetical protein [Nanoarchaeota archaeon]